MHADVQYVRQPGWMKDSKSIQGGTFQSTYVNPYAQYLLKAVQGFASKGITVYALSIQVGIA